jgi:peptidoglycan/LPS O-acetylase OafA/YrhL
MGCLRLLLALSVLIGHSDHSFGLPDVNNTLAVRSFYVISGFYMALVLRGKYRDKPYYVFIRSRYLRLFPAYCSVLALSVLCGLGTYVLTGQSGWPLHGWANTITELHPSTIVTYALSNVFIWGQDILSYCKVNNHGALLFDYLDAYKQTTFGGYMLVPQAWTLGIELSFYLIAPFLAVRSIAVVVAVMAGSFLLRLFVLPAFGVVSSAFGYRFFFFEIVYFCLGILSFDLYTFYRSRSLHGKWHWFVVGLLSLVFLSAGGAVAAPLRYAALFLIVPSLFLLTKANRLDRFVGELSYPVYISHMVVLYTLAQYYKGGNELPAILITMLLSVGIYAFVERPADVWRERLGFVSLLRFPSGRAAAACALAIAVVVCIPFTMRYYFDTAHAAVSLQPNDYDFLRETPQHIVFDGFEPTEGHGDNLWRWALGGKSEIIFSLPQAKNIMFTFQFYTIFPGQEVALYFNNMFVEKFVCEKGTVVYRKLVLPARRNDNVVRFVSKTWNGKDALPLAADSRPLSINFNQLGFSF